MIELLVPNNLAGAAENDVLPWCMVPSAAPGLPDRPFPNYPLRSAHAVDKKEPIRPAMERGNKTVQKPSMKIAAE